MPSRATSLVPVALAAALLLTACTGEPAPTPTTATASISASPSPSPEAAAPSTPTTPAVELESQQSPAWTKEQLWRACVDWRAAEEDRNGWTHPDGSWNQWDQLLIAQPQVGDLYDVQILGYFWQESVQDQVGAILECSIEGSPEDHTVTATDPEKHHSE
ncbi:hypothetical protein [Clavibacter lycopersici]|uniref:hypothetical protein n=1 Tax=Clavibacter lycopersici TaxID=2301718 RepID=UPI0013141D6A|nr:hypothetical protein [Clavibacter lycopersici]